MNACQVIKSTKCMLFKGCKSIIFAILFLNFPIIVYPQGVEERIELVCGTSRDDVNMILNAFAFKTNIFQTEMTIETIKSTYAEQMERKIKLAKEVFKDNADMINNVIEVSEKNYKFGLCEKFKRRNAKASTISSEAYLMCRKTIQQRSDAFPPACF